MSNCLMLMWQFCVPSVDLQAGILSTTSTTALLGFLCNQLWSAASKNLLSLSYVRTVLTASTDSRLAENMTAEAVDDDYIDEDGVKSTSVVWVLNNPVLFRFVEFMPLRSCYPLVCLSGVA
ncbi:unnamed protein product [Sphagnum balticum]